MIDIKFLVSNPTEVQERLGNRNPKLKEEAAKVVNLYQEYKKELQKVEDLRAKRNNLSKQIGVVRAKEG
ncbi:MAG: serine--tRNA ligase, partial [Elusimicrobiaceae bacterium]|nr:serine--tRNA ligase [Elusimicrobiaceae bacterium]